MMKDARKALIVMISGLLMVSMIVVSIIYAKPNLEPVEAAAEPAVTVAEKVVAPETKP